MAAQSPARAAYTAAALLCTFALLSTFAQADCGSFALTCSIIQVSAQGLLTCICGNGKGGYSQASLNLSAHISNNNRNLVDGALFASSCKNIQWYQLGMANQGVAAECTKVNGSLGNTTMYNMQRRVANDGGNLVFNNCRRRSLLETVDAGAKAEAESSAAIVGRKVLKM